MRKLLVALGLAVLSTTGIACDKNDTFGEKVEEAGEEIGDEIDDATN